MGCKSMRLKGKYEAAKPLKKILAEKKPLK